MSGRVFISEIHRYLVRHHNRLCFLLDVDEPRVISDTQLRRLLTLVNEQVYQHFHADYFGWQPGLLPDDSWVSFDGKELRGTIDGAVGQKRGLCLVRPLSQESNISLPGLFYQGIKDSEISCVRTLLKHTKIAGQQITFDALHTQPKTLKMILSAQGTYLAQVKANQAILLEDLQDHIQLVSPFAQTQEVSKGHGRIEQRKVSFYALTAVCFEEKWDQCGLATLAVVERETIQGKTGKISQETGFYVSNIKSSHLQPERIAHAIRRHWGIEADNWVRDCTFREDQIKCKEPARSKMLASIISVAGNLLRQRKKGWLKAMQEDLACDPLLAIPFFRHFDLL